MPAAGCWEIVHRKRRLSCITATSENKTTLDYKYHSMEHQNLFSSIPKHLTTEFFQPILSSNEISIERIISKGHKSERDFWYDQDLNEWVLLVKGAARLEFTDKTLDLKPGDYVNILAHEKHRVDWTTPDEETIWLAIFYRSSPQEPEVKAL